MVTAPTTVTTATATTPAGASAGGKFHVIEKTAFMNFHAELWKQNTQTRHTHWEKPPTTEAEQTAATAK